MKTSPLGFGLIKHFEGLLLHEYADVGKRAIGYGHDLLAGEDYPAGITEEYAEQLLARDVLKVENALEHLVPASCNQNQWDALVDFGYNLGTGALSTMLAHGWDQVPVQLPRWNHVGGQVNAAVDKRRQAELKLFQQGEEA